MSKSPKVFLKHNSVTVYHTYKEGYCRGRAMDFWYSLAKTEKAHDNSCFDIRDFGIRGIGNADESTSIENQRNNWVSYVKAELIRLIDEKKITNTIH